MYSVIIVDDEPRIRRGIAHCMPWAKLGFALSGEAGNGVEALELVRAVRPDLVITDIRMPDMDGLDFIGMIQRETRPPLVIVIRGYADFEYAQRAIRYGVADYILKPVEETNLEASIQNVLKRLQREQTLPHAACAADEETALPQKNLLIQKAQRIIETEYMNNLSLTNVASRIGIHPNYFGALFARHMGESFGSYLTKFRMKTARDLLDVTTMKVYEIAERVGYQDYRWFSKQFRQIYGITPVRYRSGSGDSSDNGEDEKGE